MKKLFGLVALMALSFVLSARAETIKVFALNINALPNSGFSQTRKDGINDMLASCEIDMGYFYNMKATSYFNLSNDAYVFTPNSTTKFVFAHKAEKYDFVADLGAFGNHANCCVIKDKADQHYAIVLAHNGNTSQAFDVSNPSKCKGYNEQIRTAITTATNAYPDARVFVTYVEGFSVNEEPLKLYLMNGPYSISAQYPPLGLSTVVDGGGKGGGIYTYLDASIADMSGSPVAIESETYNAIVGSVTYASTVNVTFKDSLSDAESVVMVAQGGTAIPPEPWNHEDIGYDFDHWEGDYSQVLAECEVLAVYAKKMLDVRFVTIDDDGLTTNVVKQEVVEWGTSATAPADPERAGYMFMGWKPSDFSCVKSDMTIVAQFEELSNVFHVRFLDSDGVTILKEEDVAGGEAATAPVDPAPHEAGDIFYGWNPSSFSRIEADTDIVAVFGPAVYEVATADEFAASIANIPPPATVKLVKDLDFSEVKDYVSPTLIGTLDGNGYTVSGLKGNVALVDKVLGGTIRNLKVADFARECTAYGQEGGLVVNRVEGGVIENVEVINSSYSAHNSSCNLTTIAYVVTSNGVGTASVVSNCVVRNCILSAVATCGLGGVVGFVGGDSEVVDCRFLTDEKTKESLGGNVSSVGGIVMEVMGGRVTRCYAEGFFAVDGTGNPANNTGVGGIVGGTTSNGKTSWIVDCTNAANVVATSQSHGAGGILGRVMKAAIRVEGCVNYGSVSVSGDEDDQEGNGCGAGGIVGGGWGTSPSVNVYISNSKNIGTVTSQDVRSAGGIVGSLIGVDAAVAYLRLTNCVNAAAVSSQNVAGGLVGHVRHIPSDVLSVVNCGNVGTVSAATNAVGGIFGRIVGQGQNNTKSFVYDGVVNVVNCSALSTDSGVVGNAVGYLEAEAYGGEYKNVHRLDLQRFFCPDRADTGLVGQVIGKEGSGATTDDASQVAMAAEDFKNRKAVKALNVYAAANDLPLWVQTKAYPDLSLWGVPYHLGLMLLFR